MKSKFLYVAITAFLLLLLAGCSNNQDVGIITDTDSYEKVREVTWEFIEEKGWNGTEVKKKIADNSYEFLDKTYGGKEVLTVSFEEKENVVIGTSLLLVYPNLNEVIGYIAGE